MYRPIAVVCILALLVACFEFATDYGEALEDTPLAAMPDGHSAGDGHHPSDHGLRCDNCHFGGVHLMGLAAAAPPRLPPATPEYFAWQAPARGLLSSSRLDRPPIV